MKKYFIVFIAVALVAISPNAFAQESGMKEEAFYGDVTAGVVFYEGVDWAYGSNVGSTAPLVKFSTEDKFFAPTLTIGKNLSKQLFPFFDDGYSKIELVSNFAFFEVDDSFTLASTTPSTVQIPLIDGSATLTAATVAAAVTSFDYAHDQYGFDFLLRSGNVQGQSGVLFEPFVGLSYIGIDQEYKIVTVSSGITTNTILENVNSDYFGGKLGGRFSGDFDENFSWYAQSSIGLYYVRSEFDGQQTATGIGSGSASVVDQKEDFTYLIEGKVGLDYLLSWGQIGLVGGVEYLDYTPKVFNNSVPFVSGESAHIVDESVTNYSLMLKVTIPFDDFLSRL